MTLDSSTSVVDFQDKESRDSGTRNMEGRVFNGAFRYVASVPCPMGNIACLVLMQEGLYLLSSSVVLCSVF